MVDGSEDGFGAVVLVRRLTLSVVRYLLRALGRPVPLGLFAGVCPTVIGDAHASWGADHRALIRPDTLWLDDVIEQLETSPALLPALNVVFCDLIIDWGDRIEMPRGGGRVSARDTAVVGLVRDAAAAPIGFAGLAAKVTDAFPGVPATTIHGALAGLVAQGVLVTELPR